MKYSFCKVIENKYGSSEYWFNQNRKYKRSNEIFFLQGYWKINMAVQNIDLTKTENRNWQMKEKLASILTEILDETITPNDIQEDTNLTTDLGMTSLNMMYFILEIENVFGVEVDLEEVDLETFFVYKTVKAYIESELE